MKSICKLQLSTDTTEVLETLAQDGCVIIEDVLSQHQIDDLKSEIETLLNQTEYCQGNFFGYKTKRASSLIMHSSTCRVMATHPAITNIMNHFLLPYCDKYQLNLTQAISIGPGEPHQILHSDDLMFPFSHDGYDVMINCMWAVDDFTESNGATCVIPGSHKWPRDRLPQEHEAIRAVMKKGSVLVYFASLQHGGGANISDMSRTGVVLSYCLGWLRQAENHYLSIPHDLVRSYPENLQRLLGYFVHKPNLGCVNGRDPFELLVPSHDRSESFKEFLRDDVQEILIEHRNKALTSMAR